MNKVDDFVLGEWMESLKELFQCPVCAKLILPTQSVCKNGHIVCGKCRSQFKKCITCQEDFVVERVTLLNHIFENLPRICPFKGKGCTKVIVSEEHVDFCEYRLVECKVSRCNWKGPLKDLIDHVKSSHSGRIRDVESKACLDVSFKLTQNRSIGTMLLYKGNSFWMYVKVNGPSKGIGFKFAHLPQETPKTKFYFIVTFKKGEIEYTSTFKAVISSKDEEEVSGLEEEDRILIPDSEIDRFENSRGLMECKMKIIEEEIPGNAVSGVLAYNISRMQISTTNPPNDSVIPIDD